MHRLIRIIALTGIVILAALSVTSWVVQGDPAALAQTPLQSLAGLLGVDSDAPASPSGVRVGGPFTLVDSTGKTVTDEDFRGRWMLVYFGYTFCPDVCPTELQTMSAALSKLGPEANRVAPIFITVDPERDTPQTMGAYVKLFDPRLIGLSGSKQQIADVTRAYRVYYAKVAQSGGDSSYLMDHSSLVYVMDTRGRFAALYNPHTDADDMAAGLRDLMSQKG